MRRRDPHDDPAPVPARPRAAVPVPTLGQLLRQPYWTWLLCDACGHRVAVALVPFVIRWGPATRRPTCCASMRDAQSAAGARRHCSIRAGLTQRRAGSHFRWRRTFPYVNANPKKLCLAAAPRAAPACSRTPWRSGSLPPHAGRARPRWAGGMGGVKRITATFR
jgi:hypothetical protein